MSDELGKVEAKVEEVKTKTKEGIKKAEAASETFIDKAKEEIEHVVEEVKEEIKHIVEKIEGWIHPGPAIVPPTPPSATPVVKDGPVVPPSA